ncbi:uncharacterized protein [Drosophila takahashii]|uniref:uncharacterized protein n=1 Tax=Drosophila takahashii TaxID=29030 RepID=UPI001CF8E5A4|nr:uncharacterized protein LOC108059117 isoform X1 [Drosophila takahashii]
MQNLIKSRALFEILKHPLPDNYFDSDSGEEEIVEYHVVLPSDWDLHLAGQPSTVKLCADAPEFVPRSMKIPKEFTQDEDEDKVDLTEIKRMFESLDELKMMEAKAQDEDKDEKVDLTEIKRKFEALDEQKVAKMTTMPWKGFPKRQAERTARSAQVILLNDSDYMIVPRNKGKKKSSNMENFPGENTAEYEENVVPFPSHILADLPPADERLTKAQEKRREQERKVALEALKLVEQRRMRGPLVSNPDEGKSDNPEKPQPVVHLSRSPIRFSPEERIQVDRLRVAKRERIEKALLEMANEKKKEQAVLSTKRYIPTAKEWDEQRRAKHLAQMEADKENVNCNRLANARAKQPVMKPNGQPSMPSKSIKKGDPGAPAKQLYCPPGGKLLKDEKRKGNLTHYQTTRKWSSRKCSKAPMKLVQNPDGTVVKRYSIEELLQFEPQPEDLEKPHVDEALKRFGFLI